MKKISVTVCLLFILVAQAQGEANIWYFGNNAGLDFSSGSPIALTNGQLLTDEGCATISTSTGQLLFYTDGVTVYNKNHVVMQNGSGLMGHPSSAQSATIVQKPGTSNLFYIFTTDNEHDPNGFRYTLVDINLDNGNGAVTTEKNVLVYTPTTEGFGVTKHGNGSDFWIMTHGWNNNSFIAYQLTAAGLNTVPVVTNIGLPITGTGFTAAGMIKFSQSGAKLAITSVSDFAQLYDFNNTTGVLSNPITLVIEPGELMGIAFSPNESVLYISNPFNKLYQFNLNAPNIPNSRISLHSTAPPFIFYSQMQLGPDNKIYIAIRNKLKIGVINNPNVLGLGCSFIIDGIDLAGRTCKGGLPSFNQSFFFTPNIQFSSNCEGENANFTFTTNQTVLSTNWNFGDGNTSSAVNPTHIYTAAGTYTVTVTLTTPQGTGSNTRTITILPKLVLSQNSVNLKQCDDNNDGFSAFNLNQANQLVVANTIGLTFSYFKTLSNAQTNSNPIPNFTTYTNQTVNSESIFIRVQNASNCFSIATLNLMVTTTLIPTTFQKVFTVCDNSSSGSNTDGIATFDFSSATSQILALYPAGQVLTVSYFKNSADALAEQNAIPNSANYTNVGYPNSQNIYVRVDSVLNNECLGLGHHITLRVESLPIINPIVLTNCDDNNDGLFGFDTANLNANLLNGLTNVSLSFWDQNNNPLPSPLPNPFLTASQIIRVRATNNTTLGCFFETTITFKVDLLPLANFIPTGLTTFCDDESDPTIQNGIVSFDTSTFQTIILGNQTGMIVKYYDQNNAVLSSPLHNPFTTTNQNIRVEVINPTNLNCKAQLIIPFKINKVPKINLTGNELVCSNNPNFTKIIDAGLIDFSTINDYSYKWFFNDALIPTAASYTLTVNAAGIYKVEVENSLGCFRTRIFDVVASEIATIKAINVSDLADSNTIEVIATGLGDYIYSLDNQNYQTSPIFTNVLAGIYTVFVKDKNRCGIAKKDISVLGIPIFFTPNGDGFNDTWKINGINKDFCAKTVMTIFDRFGKLIIQINPLDSGWDGTLKGQIMPADDYWYVIQLEDNRTLKGHFALKR